METEMDVRRTKFYLDKQNGKLLGVCAGLADYTGWDLALIRVCAVGLTLIAGGTTIPLYFIASWIVPNKPVGLYDDDDDRKFWQQVRRSPRATTRDVRSKFREIDRRLADVEVYYTTRNSKLADEIEALR